MSPPLRFFAAALAVVAVSCAAYGACIPSFVAAHGVDKVLHAAMGATLTYLLARAIAPRHAGIAAAMVFVPLALDEYLQRYSSVRSSDWADLAADVLGIALAAWAVQRRTAKQVRFSRA